MEKTPTPFDTPLPSEVNNLFNINLRLPARRADARPGSPTFRVTYSLFLHYSLGYPTLSTEHSHDIVSFAYYSSKQFYFLERNKWAGMVSNSEHMIEKRVAR